MYHTVCAEIVVAVQLKIVKGFLYIPTLLELNDALMHFN